MTNARRTLWIGAGAMALVFVVLRVVPFAGAHTGRGVDSLDYRASADLPLLSKAFLAGARPAGYPLFLKAMAHNESAAVVVQFLLDTVAWLALALMAARATRQRALRWVVAGVVLAIGLAFDVIQWDRIVSSETLSTTCAIGLLAALLWLRERWSVPRLAVVAVLALGAAAVRDSNGSFLGLVAIALILLTVTRALPRRVFALAAVFLVVAALASISASGGRRWEGPLKDVITIRVLDSPERTGFFVDHGLPLTPEQIANARGKCVTPTPTFGCATISDPRFYEWIRAHGRSVYAQSLAKFPATTVWEPLAHLRESVGTRLPLELRATVDTREHAPVSKLLEAFVFVRNPALLVLWAIAVLGASAVALVRRVRGVYLFGAALVLLVYPHLTLVWLGGAMEVTRHSLLASYQLRLGLWLTTLWLLDAFLTDRSVRREGRADDQDGDPSGRLP